MINRTPFQIRFKQILSQQPILVWLIVINIGVWFFLNLVQLGDFLMHTGGAGVWLTQMLSLLAVPASCQALLMKPWTLFTYMFVHSGFWHLFMNMIWLYWFGKIFLEFRKGKELLVIYILGGIVGAFVFVLAYNIFPVFEQSLQQASAIGASASVLAITIATAVLVPNYSVMLLFFGQVKIKYIAIFAVILDILMIRSGNAGGHFAHLGGALCGVIYMLLATRYSKISCRFPRFHISIKPFRRKPKLRKTYTAQRPLSDEEYNTLKAEKQKRIDSILDKISKSGYSSLSAEEKEYLFNSSKH